MNAGIYVWAFILVIEGRSCIRNLYNIIDKQLFVKKCYKCK